MREWVRHLRDGYAETSGDRKPFVIPHGALEDTPEHLIDFAFPFSRSFVTTHPLDATEAVKHLFLRLWRAGADPDDYTTRTRFFLDPVTRGVSRVVHCELLKDGLRHGEMSYDIASVTQFIDTPGYELRENPPLPDGTPDYQLVLRRRQRTARLLERLRRRAPLE